MEPPGAERNVRPLDLDGNQSVENEATQSAVTLRSCHTWSTARLVARQQLVAVEATAPRRLRKGIDHPIGALSLFDLDLKDKAARILGRKTDIMTRHHLHPSLRQRIEASAVQVF